MKQQREFFFTGDEEWVPGAQPGTWDRVLSASADDPTIMTKLVRWEAGLDTSAAGVIEHEYCEEVYLIAGDLHDLTLNVTFTSGCFTARNPGMPHGPYRTDGGCVMLEIRHRAG